MQASIMCIDVVESTALMNRLGDDGPRVFEDFHQREDAVIARYRGEIYERTGDGCIALFPSAADGLNAAIEILETISESDTSGEDATLHLRIGLTAVPDLTLLGEPKDDRNRGSHIALFQVAKLQKACPTGRLAISHTLFDMIGGRRSSFRPATSPELRALNAYVYHGRQNVPQHGFLAGLSETRAAAIPPLLITAWPRLVADKFSVFDLPSFVRSDVLVIFGETIRRIDTNHGSAATSDAVGLIEIFARLPATTGMTASIDAWHESGDLAGRRDLIVVGSGICNSFAFVINDLMRPVRFDKHEGKVFAEIVALQGDINFRFSSRENAGRHCALVLTTANPFAPGRRMVWVAGITGRGTQAAMTFLSDLIDRGPGLLTALGLPQGVKPVACVLQARMDKEREEPGGGRVGEYELLWTSDAEGNYINLYTQRRGRP